MTRVSLPRPAVPLLAVMLLGAVAPAAAQQPPRTGQDVIRAMHRRYDGKWYRTLSFVQRAIYPSNRVEEEWWEAALIPGFLRIDVAPLDSGRTFMYRGDSTFTFDHGKVIRAAAGRNILAIMAFDVYRQLPEKTFDLVAAEQFPLDRLREDTFRGVPCWVIGDEHHQLWIEKERLILHRVISPGPGGVVSDVSFSKFEPLGGGWIGTEVLFLRDGKEVFREIYRDWKINPAITEDLFAMPWKPASWARP